ncbi:MAG: Ig-like domain-containing protein [bacterium]
MSTRLLNNILMMVLIATLLNVTSSHGQEVVRDEFENSGSSTQPVQGIQGWGFTQRTDEFVLENPELVDYSINLGPAGQGIISFDLMKIEGDFYDDRTVFALLDQDEVPLFEMEIAWSAVFDPDVPVANFSGRAFYREGLNMWSPWVPLDNKVEPGQWVHFDIVWNDADERYFLFVDNRLQNPGGDYIDHRTGQVQADPRLGTIAERIARGEEPDFFAGKFADIARRVAILRLGIHTVPSNPGIGTSPLANAVLDNFSIRVGQMKLISSVSHNAFSVAGFSGRLVAGDTITVIMNGEPGGQATFDLGDGITTVSMAEDQAKPGTYRGTYAVKPGDYVESGTLTGRLVGRLGLRAVPVAATRTIDIDGTTHFDVKASNDLIPADEESKAGFTVVARDANDKPVRDHELLLTMSTTDEYTGIVGGGAFADMVGGEMDVDWGSVTDSFGEVSAQYISGFAAKTVLVSAKDMVSGDVGVGYVRSFITGTVDVLVKKPQAAALSLSGSMEVSLSRDWLTADGHSRSRITAVVRDESGDLVAGERIRFTLLGDNGSIKEIKSHTDSRGRAFADYIAGTVIGEVQIEVRDLTGGHVAVVSIELRSDAPAEIALTAEPGEIFTDDKTGSVITAKVSDANGNPNFNTDVLFEVASGGGTMSADSAVTDEKDGIASVNFLPGSEPGLSTIKATIISRAPTADEVAAAEGAVFLFGLDDDPGRLEVIEWLAGPGDEVSEGQDLVKLEDRRGTVYMVKAPRDGIASVFTAEEEDRVEYGQTLGYILPLVK